MVETRHGASLHTIGLSFLPLLPEQVGSAEGGQQQGAVANGRVPVFARAVVAWVVDVELVVRVTRVVDAIVDEEHLGIGDEAEAEHEQKCG